MVDSHSTGLVVSPVAGKAYVSAHESVFVSVLPDRAWAWMPVTSYSVQNVGDWLVHAAAAAAVQVIGHVGPVARRVAVVSVEVAHPVGEVSQRPLTAKVTCAAGLVEYTDPSRWPYWIFDMYPPRM